MKKPYESVNVFILNLIMFFGTIQIIYSNPTPQDTLQILSGQAVSWDNPTEINETYIRIDSGALLTVTDTAWLKPGAKIVVMPGGKMIVDGGRLTGFCTWDGIEVWGTPENIQVPAVQGWLSISNGGTMENAVTGVRVGSEDFADKGGGIVHTEEAVFRNNRSGVIYHEYAGSNIGNFNLSTFETNDKLMDSSLPEEHLRLVGVEGISINGCTFRNTRDGNIPYNQRGTGIISFDASYDVDHFRISQSMPCTQYQETVFDSLYYGIQAYALFSVQAPSVENTGFTHNFRGVYTSGITRGKAKFVVR